MRAAWLILPCAALALAACDRTPRRPGAPAAASKTITIQTSEPPAARVAASGGKLAVMERPLEPAVAAPAPVARPAPDRGQPPARYATRDDPNVDPRGAPDYDPRRDGDPELGDQSLTRRECRQAERDGDPAADSRACRDLLAEARLPPADPGLVADCRDADRIGDPFARSRVCRRVLGR